MTEILIQFNVDKFALKIKNKQKYKAVDLGVLVFEFLQKPSILRTPDLWQTLEREKKYYYCECGKEDA